MIKRKLEQRAQAGRRLIARAAEPGKQNSLMEPSVGDQSGSDSASSTEINTSHGGEQSSDTAQLQLELLRASIPKRASKKVAERREQKPKTEKRGFG